MLRLVDAHLRVDPLGGAAQRELAERDEVPLAEEALERALRLLRDVDLPVPEALEQLVGREVDQTHLGRPPRARRSGHRLAHDDAGDLRDDVVEALDVLHVERRVDVDPSVEELFDVLPALRVARARRVRVRELVDEDEAGPPRERGVEIELLDGDAAVQRPCVAAAARGR